MNKMAYKKTAIYNSPYGKMVRKRCVVCWHNHPEEKWKKQRLGGFILHYEGVCKGKLTPEKCEAVNAICEECFRKIFGKIFAGKIGG